EQPIGGLARHGPGGVARKYVDVAGTQRVEARGGVERDKLHFAGVVEDRGGDRAAQIDVEPAPVALVVEAGKPGEPSLAYPADKLAPLFHLFQRLRAGRRCQDAGERRERAT